METYNLEYYFRNNDIISFKKELVNFIKYIAKKHYCKKLDYINYFDDIVENIFLFVYDKLLDERYKYNSCKGNFLSYIYYLIRWSFTNNLWEINREYNFSERLKKVDKDDNIINKYNMNYVNNVFKEKIVEDIIYLCNVYEIDIDINDILDFLLFKKSKKKKMGEDKLAYLQLICWCLYRNDCIEGGGCDIDKRF